MTENGSDDDFLSSVYGCGCIVILVAFFICLALHRLIYFLLFWLIILVIFIAYKVNSYLQEQAAVEVQRKKQLEEHYTVPIYRYAGTKKEVLSQLEVSDDDFVQFAKQELDTFFMDEWIKMREIYQDKTGKFDKGHMAIAWEQMCEILDVIFSKFEKKKLKERTEQAAIDEELRKQYAKEVAVAKTVYQKWTDDDLETKP